MAVRFSATLKIKLPSKSNLKDWIVKLATSEKRKAGNLAFNFCADEELWQMNKQFLKHDTLTDIITFDYSEDDTVSGEIYISAERVKENAEKLNIPFQEELVRVMAHGILHLCGHNDKSPIQQKQMRAAENRAIRLFHSLTG